MSEIWRHICHRRVGTHVSVPQPDGDDITYVFFTDLHLLGTIKLSKNVQTQHGRANAATQTKVNHNLLFSI